MARSITRRNAIKLTAAAGLISSLPAKAQEAENPLRERIIEGDKRPIVRPGETRFGCYDPYGDFAEQMDVSTEALFLPWEDVDLSTLPAADAYALARKRKILISVEPWTWGSNVRVTREGLQTGIVRGAYDANVQAIIDVVRNFQSPIIIRWAQEMEDPRNRFSWSGWPADVYIEAYNRVMRLFRQGLPKAQLMWSPKGLENMNQYYPDDTLVDLVGLSLFALDRYDLIEWKGLKYLEERFQEPYDRAVIHGKPIWIAEFGYEGENEQVRIDYMERWAREATNAFPQFPRLEEVVWFNDREPYPWPYDLGRPDWRVIRQTKLTQR